MRALHLQWSVRVIMPALATAAVGLMFCARGLAEPKPSATPVEWELKFTFQTPQRIAVALPGKASHFWYVLYRVVNDTGADRDFLPVLERVAESESELPAEQVDKNPDQAPQILRSSARVGLDPAVFRAIKARHAKTHPFLVSPIEAIGRIKEGADNAVDSVAIFDDLDARYSSFTIYVGGLTGERKQIANPSFDPKKPADDKKNPRSFVIQKTLALPYRLPGDPASRRVVEPALERLHWVMR